MKTEVEVPFVKAFNDYHDIDAFKDDINQVCHPKLKALEITDYKDTYDTFRDTQIGYVGLFYVGKKPEHKEICKLLDDAGYEKFDK